MRKSIPCVPDEVHPTHPEPVLVQDNLMVVLSPQGTVRFYDSSAASFLTEVLPTQEGQQIKNFYFSPMANFFVTYEPHVKASSQDNVNLYYLAKKNGLQLVKVDSFVLSKFSTALFPCYKFTAGEEYCTLFLHRVYTEKHFETAKCMSIGHVVLVLQFVMKVYTRSRYCCKLVSTGICVYDLKSINLKHMHYVEKILCLAEESDESIIETLQKKIFKTSRKIKAPKCAYFELSNSVHGFGSSTNGKNFRNCGYATSTLSGQNFAVERQVLVLINFMRILIQWIVVIPLRMVQIRNQRLPGRPKCTSPSCIAERKFSVHARICYMLCGCRTYG